LKKQNILLITHGNFETTLLDRIASDITIEYQWPVRFMENHMDLTEFYEPVRRQYDGNKLLKLMDSMSPPDALKTIGLFRVDLFIPILTYIFGQAIFNGKTGIASLYRLRNEQYGIKKDDAILFERFRKVIIHELGHTFGLVHCYVPNCVMRSSTYVENIDQKRYNLCPKCRTEMYNA
jgi:archaemetzincin